MFDDTMYSTLCSAVTLQSNKNGFFQHVADNIVNSVDEEWLLDFGKLKNNSQRIIKCLNDKKIKDEVLQMMNNVQEIYRGKSASMSRLRRQEAEHLYKNGKKDKSLLMYTQSVVRAPVAGVDKNFDDGLTLAAALWNRSTVLYQMEKIRPCLDDIKLCLQEKLPDNLRLEAYWRMAECYIYLKKFDQARISLNILLQITQTNECTNTSVEWSEKIQSKLNELIACISQSKNLSSNLNAGANDNQTEPTLTLGENMKLKNASSKLRLAENVKSGRHFIANESIKTGDTLIVEDPYVCCLSTEKYGSHCHHCLRRLESAIPCNDCSGVAFCCLDCRMSALKTYHKFECHYLDLLIGSGMSILCFAALKIVSQQDVKYFVDADLDCDTDNSHPYRQIYNMVAHADKRKTDDFLRRTLMAIFLLAVLKKSRYFCNSTNVDDIGPQELLIARVLLRNLEILQFNAHEISEVVKLKNSTKSLKAINIGIGLYKTASYFNHECFPSVSRYFHGTKLIIRAIRPVDRDQIVGDSYGPVFTKVEKLERQRKLSGRYWFQCECQACIENWPLLSNANTTLKLRCCHCRFMVEECDNNNKTCTNCGKILNSDISIKIAELKKMLNTPQENLNEEIIQKMCTSFDLVSETLCPPSVINQEVGDKLQQFWMNSGYVLTL